MAQTMGTIEQRQAAEAASKLMIQNGPVVTTQAATQMVEFPSIGFTLPRALVEQIDADALKEEVSRSQYLRQMIADAFKFTLPDAKPRGRASTFNGTPKEKENEFARRAIVASLGSRAEKLALGKEVMDAIKAGKMLTEDELNGAIMRHTSDLIAAYEKRNSVSLAEGKYVKPTK